MWIREARRGGTRRGEARRNRGGRRGVPRHGATDEERERREPKQANELARARSRHAAAVWRQGSPCSLKQSRRMPPTHLSRPTYRAILKPACIPGAGFPLSFLPSSFFLAPRSCARPSSSPHPAADAAACVRRRTAPFDEFDRRRRYIFRQVEISRIIVRSNKLFKLSNCPIGTFSPFVSHIHVTFKLQLKRNIRSPLSWRSLGEIRCVAASVGKRSIESWYFCSLPEAAFYL